MNCIRVWGGGCYPDDSFYDICDELGLLVWQDFMFACAVYDLTEDFERNITAEFIDNVRRLRHHASLALWCGNNEMEEFVDKGEWVSSPKQKADYIKMYEYIIPKVLREEDPQAFSDYRKDLMYARNCSFFALHTTCRSCGKNASRSG